MRKGLIILVMLLCFGELYGRGPMYVVGGKIMQSIDHIPQEDIESIDVLPADEETIAKWGADASEGVILVTLRYDINATFSHDGYNNYTEYLGATVKWDTMMPAERVSLRIEVTAEGQATIKEVLESTSKQLLKRVERAINESPLWQPAMRNGIATSSTHLVNLQLPRGKSMQQEMGIIIR